MTARVGGHGLRGEGAPFTRQGCCSDEQQPMRTGRLLMSTGGEGHGLCECGAQSEHLGSSTRRKAWHREHKAEVSR